MLLTLLQRLYNVVCSLGYHYSEILKTGYFTSGMSLILYGRRPNTLSQCWFSVGPPSTTMDQRLANIDSTSCVCWVVNPESCVTVFCNTTGWSLSISWKSDYLLVTYIMYYLLPGLEPLGICFNLSHVVMYPSIVWHNKKWHSAMYYF